VLIEFVFFEISRSEYLTKSAWKCIFGPPTSCFWWVSTPEHYLLSFRPPRGISVRGNTRCEVSLIGRCRSYGVTWRRGEEYKKQKEPKVRQNSLFSQTPFPSADVNQILHARSLARYLPWFWASERSVGKCGSCEGSKFWPSHWQGTSHIQPHKPWLVYDSRIQC